MSLMEELQEPLPGQRFPSCMAVMQRLREATEMLCTCCKTHSTRLNGSCHRQVSSLHCQLNDLTKGSQQTPRAGFINAQASSLLREAHAATQLPAGLTAQGWLQLEETATAAGCGLGEAVRALMGIGSCQLHAVSLSSQAPS